MPRASRKPASAVLLNKRSLEYLPVDALVPYANNARTHSDAQIAAIAASIKEFSFTNPVLIDGDAGIIAGHGRVLAARLLGMAEVPCIRLPDLTPTQRRALVLADNRLALSAGWNDDLLRLELGELKLADFDLALTGFTGEELAELLAERTEGLTDPDDAPEPPANPVTQAGDVWLMGRHRLVCGDCSDADAVAKALNGVVPHLMITDPPYGVEYDPKWRDRYEATSKPTSFGKPNTRPMTGKAVRHALGKVENDDRADWREAWDLFPGDVAYVWHGGLHSATVQASLEAAGFVMRAQIIWTKQHFVFSRGDYHWQHEPCWYAVRSRGTGHYAGDRKQTTVWNIANHNPMGGKADDTTSGHGTQKPVECMRRPVENNSSPGQAVYDPFVGSGTTIIAAEQTGRACHAIELNPAYCDVAVLRWQAFTGQQATLADDGRTFAAVADDRYDPAANSAGSYTDAIDALRKRAGG